MKKNKVLIISTVLIIFLVAIRLQDIEADDSSLFSADTRLLVVAPHPDDETLSSAVFMKRVLDAGGEVKVVFITNGDAYKEAAQTYFKKTLLSSVNYLMFGKVRQGEARNALSKINVTDDKVMFLGYPDQGMMSLFNDNWSIEKPYRSKHTWANQNLYNDAYEPKVYYCGENVLRNIKEIIEDFEPTVVIYPDIKDNNQDHKATNFFVRRALNEMNYEVTELTYLVHYKTWPIMINGSVTSKSLLAPNALVNDDHEWVDLPITPDERNLALLMLSSHKTQLNAMYKLNYVFLYSFVRANELFRLASVS